LLHWGQGREESKYYGFYNRELPFYGMVFVHVLSTFFYDKGKQQVIGLSTT
jgi:hypothetical protein